MLAGGYHALIFGIQTALKTIDKVVDVRGKMERVLSGGFLTSAPTRVPKRVDVGCPIIKTSAIKVVEGSRLGRNDSGHVSDELIVESSAHQDGLWEGGGHAEVAIVREVDARGVGHAVQSFLPPSVGWKSETWNTRADMSCVVELLLNSKELDEGGGSCQRI